MSESKTYGVVPNAPKLTGRQTGATNKQTRLRNEMMREKLLKTNFIFKTVDELNRRLDEDPESISFASLLNAISKVAPYLYQTVSEEQIEDVIAEITTREEAEKELGKILDITNKLRAVK